MTHTLHRRGSRESLNEDYVVLTIPAVGSPNYDGHETKLQSFLRLALRHKPKNIGSVEMGGMIDQPEEVIANARKIAHAVFDNKEAVTEFLKALKQADLGLSVVVSGIYENVDQCLEKVGLKHHTANFSLGVWGRTEKLPSNDILEVTTMCGHALIPANLVKVMVAEIKASRKTPQEAAKALMPHCTCGVYNPARAAKLLAAMAAK